MGEAEAKAEAKLPLDAHKNLEEVISSLPPPLLQLPPSLSADEEGVPSFTPMPDMSGLEGLAFSSSFPEMEGMSPTSLFPAIDWAHPPPPPPLPGMGGVPPPPPPLGGLTAGAIQS